MAGRAGVGRGQHPVHASLAAFPLALFTAALVSDVAYANTAQMQWANFSVWLIAGGVLMGVIAAITGIADALINRPRKSADRLHGILTLALFVVAIVNGFVHSRDAWTSVVPTGLVLSIVMVVLVWITTWQGYAVQAPRTGELA